MSIATEVSRLQDAKAAIKAAIEGKGVTVPDGTLLDGMAALIESIQAGGDSSTKDVYFGTYNPNGTHTYIIIPFHTIPDVLVIVGPVSGSNSNNVGLAIYIKDADGGIYQEKWRYQSTKYLVGTSATDGSLFTLSVDSNTRLVLSINSGDTSYGKYFDSLEYRVFAAKLF